MWTAKIKIDGKKGLIGSKAVKNKVNLFGFPLSYKIENNGICVQIIGNIFGDKENIKKFYKELKKEKRVFNIEINNNFLIALIKEPLCLRLIYNKKIFHISPAFISEEGFETLNIGSFERKILMDITKVLEKEYDGKLISIQKKKIKSILMAKISPELTERQKGSISLAIKHGYYHSPRRTDIKNLAKISGLSYSTFQVHLRKAEEKLIPFFYEF